MENNSLFEPWHVFSQEEQSKYIAELESQPERRLDAMRAILKSSWKSRWLSATQAIHALGYPGNADALPELIIDQVGDVNSAGWKEAVQTLLEMPPKIVCEYIIQVLWDRGRSLMYWDSVVEGICKMLGQIEGSYAVHCCPMLIYLLDKEDLPENFDKSVLLDVLEVIPEENIVYGIPVLLDLCQKNDRNTLIGEQIRSLINTFSEANRVLYQKLLANI